MRLAPISVRRMLLQFVVARRLGILTMMFVTGVGLCASSVRAQDAATHQQTIDLREHLGRDWKRQLLSFDFEAPRGACDPESIRVLGPSGVVIPAQLTDITFWADTRTVRHARLWFVSDLDAYSAGDYAVRYGPTRSEHVPARTDLIVKVTDQHIELHNRHFGVRLLQGEQTFDPPRPAAQVPGPVRALMVSRDNQPRWFGASEMYGQSRIVACAAELLEAGPLIGAAQVRYTYENGMTFTLCVELCANDTVALWDERIDKGQDLNAGWRLVFSEGLEAPTLTATGKSRVKWSLGDIKPGKRGTLNLAAQKPGVIVAMQPWADWWGHTRLLEWEIGTEHDGELLQFARHDPGAWVRPQPAGQWGAWGLWLRKMIALRVDEQGRVFHQHNLAAGARRWLGGAVGQTLGRRLNVVKDYALEWSSAAAHPRLFLDRAALDAYWQSSRDEDPNELKQLIRHGSQWMGRPHAFTDKAVLRAYLLSGGDPDVAGQTRLVERVTHYLDIVAQADLSPSAHRLGQNPKQQFDLFRDSAQVAAMTDVVLGSDLIDQTQRQRLRARLAYLGYVLSEPAVWSTERGYRTGNLNMVMGYAASRGLIACVLPEHPAALDWLVAQRDGDELSVTAMEKFLQRIGPQGEFPESVSNYMHVSVSPMLALAIALRNGPTLRRDGQPDVRDYLDDPRLRRLARYIAAQSTPPDPRRGGRSVFVPSGRGNALGTGAITGLLARAYATQDPQFSRQMQWHWQRTGYTQSLSHSPLAGMGRIYLDSSLPAEKSGGISQWFPHVGAVLRHGFGTAHEYYINYLMIAANHYHDWYPSESGGFPVVFSQGVPIAARFPGGYADREELLTSRVLPCRPRGDMAYRRDHFYHAPPKDQVGHGSITAFSTLSRQDYLTSNMTMHQPTKVVHGRNEAPPALPEWPAPVGEAKAPITWSRQLLFVKAAQPDGASYFVLRDQIHDNEPTMWQFWTLSQKIGTPSQAENLRSFLSDAPGNAPVSPRMLHGDRFTAIGQFDVDVEFYIGAPAQTSDTPRHTLRWGREYSASPLVGHAEYQDLLHIQMPGRGFYYVAVFPRKRDMPAPQFTTVGNGSIMRVNGDFGLDHVFMSHQKATARADDIAFRGTAGSVQQRANTVVLSIGDSGYVSWRDYSLTSQHGASLRIDKEALHLELTAQRNGVAEVVVTAPGTWRLHDNVTGVQLIESDQGALRIRVPQGVRQVTLLP